MKIYIEFLNKSKNFEKDIKYFDDFKKAKEWALKNIENFNLDMINFI